MSADGAFPALLEFLKQSRGFDFTGYKQASLERRFRRRMETVGCEELRRLPRLSRGPPGRISSCCSTRCSSTSRSSSAIRPCWSYLQAEVLPQILAAKPPDEGVRVWSAGCATGQEAMTVAMLLAELLGLEEYGERVKIYATDVDQHALGSGAPGGVHAPGDRRRAAASCGSATSSAATSATRCARNCGRTLIFGRNNLIDDAPISRLDLLVCRNTLIYFNAETQERILRHLHFALRPDRRARTRQIGDADRPPRSLRDARSQAPDLPARASGADACSRASRR